jgi:pSer/pThr/pTyr-binding forkhead associated (FHA) protein
MVHCALNNAALIGREDADLNFPLDVFMSGNHAKLERQGDQFLLTDLQSRNGTFVRVRGEQELVHGDYLFLGKQLLRVEMTA